MKQKHVSQSVRAAMEVECKVKEGWNSSKSKIEEEELLVDFPSDIRDHRESKNNQKYQI